MLILVEIVGELFGVRSLIEELGDKEGFIEGDARTGLGSVDGEDLRDDCGDWVVPKLVLGRVAGEVLKLVEFTVLRENFVKGVDESVVKLVVLGIIGEDILVDLKGMKGEPLGELFGGEVGGDFTGDFGKDFVSIVSFSRERFKCDGLL